MKPLDRLSEYLGAIERRLRLLAWTRGAAVIAAAALCLTVLAVLAANQFSFSNPSVIGARVFLFLGLALAAAAALIMPVIRLNRRHAARKAETRYPQFEERLLTFTEKVNQTPNDPFLHLLASDTLAVAQQAEPKEVAKTAVIFSFSSAALVAMLTLIWLGMSGPGFLGYGTSLLWGGLPKGEMQPFYSIKVEPGNKTIRKRADLEVSATLMGFQAPKVRFFGKYASASQWEEAEMKSGTGGSAYRFLIAGVPESMEYYVEAAGVRSETFKLKVMDLPVVKKTRVTYHFPAWSGMKDEVEDPGGDLRAVEGTNAEVVVQSDRPLANGVFIFDDGTKISLSSRSDGTVAANVPIQKDGRFYIAAVESGEDVRLTDDYFVEAMKDQEPELKITRPGRDFRATPIEEVTIAVDAKDDFGLKDVSLHYSVNGGAEKTVPMLKAAGSKNGSGQTVLALEDFKMVPGDVVSLYATAKDARKTVNTDMFFIEAQPFERNYTQSQQAGGGGGGGGEQEEDQISQRQKDIITATWNQVKGRGAKMSDAENASFMAGMQSKLRDQAKSLADRMRARQLEGAGDSFKSFVQDMEKAVEAMGPAAENLKAAKWKDALQPEQKALQHLLRAEATFRDIQVAFGQQRGGGGGGGGGRGATRDLQGLFDLELDTEKNQYEGAQRGMPGGSDSQQKAIDEALQKLKELAKRQQELAEQQRRNPQATSQQRWEQEQLRREAEKLQQQLQQMQQGGQLSRNGQQQSQQQSGQGQQQGQQAQSGQQQGQRPQTSQQQQQGQQGGQMSQQTQQQLQQLIERLKQATDDMRQANNPNQTGTPQGEAQARKAAERLREAEQMFSGLRNQQSSGQLDNLVQQADDLARRQQDFEGQMRRAYGSDRGVNREQQEQLARQKDQEAADLKKLEQEMQATARDLQSTQREASTKVREALGDVQQMELARGMQRGAQWIRQGMGQYVVMSESQITAGLNELRDQLKQAQQAMGKDGKSAQSEQAVESALRQTEQLRRMLEQFNNQQQGQRGQGQQMARNGQQGQQPGGQQQNGQQQNGQQQNGQAGGGKQQGSQGGQQTGGQQSGQAGGQGQQGGQPNGQLAEGQPGGRQNGGNPTGGNSGGAWDGGRWNGGTGGPWIDGPVRLGDIQQSYRGALQSLQELQQQYRDDPNNAREIQGLIRGLREFDPMALGNDALLSQRIGAALAGVEQVELELRRKVDASSTGGSVRASSGEKMPEGYDKQVEEYRRKLSKAK